MQVIRGRKMLTNEKLYLHKHKKLRFHKKTSLLQNVNRLINFQILSVIKFQNLANNENHYQCTYGRFRNQLY